MTTWVDQVGNFVDGRHCRMIADTLAELHETAEAAGISKDQYVESTIRPHYRLTENERVDTIERGLALPVGFVHGCTTGVA